MNLACEVQGPRRRFPARTLAVEISSCRTALVAGLVGARDLRAAAAEDAAPHEAELAVAEADQEPGIVVPHDPGVEQQGDPFALPERDEAGIALARPAADDPAPGAGLDRPVEIGRAGIRRPAGAEPPPTARRGTPARREPGRFRNACIIFPLLPSRQGAAPGSNVRAGMARNSSERNRPRSSTPPRHDRTIVAWATRTGPDRPIVAIFDPLAPGGRSES